ncbi:hypothetical protein [Actinomadura sp. 21ATH]
MRREAHLRDHVHIRGQWRERVLYTTLAAGAINRDWRAADG